MHFYWHIYMGGLYLLLGSFFLLAGGILVRIDIQFHRILLRAGDNRFSRWLMRSLLLLAEGAFVIFGILCLISNFIYP